eukprot:838033-Rhodomonas_salina.1
MPQVYDLTLPEDFDGGVKNWEAYDGVIISTFMDARLSIIVDIASAVVTACQKSLSVGTPFVFLAALALAPGQQQHCLLFTKWKWGEGERKGWWRGGGWKGRSSGLESIA